MDDPSGLNLWAHQWRDECLRRARAGYRERAAAYDCLKDKTTDYALSLKMARDVFAQVLAVWEASPVDLRSTPEKAGGVSDGVGQFQRVTGTLPGGEATYRFADGVPAVAPAGPVVGPSGSDWVLVGYFMEDGGRWLKMDSIYADDPDAVGLYRKRYAGVQACTFPDCSCPPDGQGEVHCPHGVQEVPRG